jgi:hypothetical protein
MASSEEPTPPPDRRDNELRATEYTPLADLDPRVASALLSKLAQAGIAAYVAPTPSRTSWYRAAHIPSRPTDRLWVALSATQTARTIIADEQGEQLAASLPGDDQRAFEQIVAGYDAQVEPGTQAWPESEDVPVVSGRPLTGPAGSEAPVPFRTWSPPQDPLDEHFEPPAPPPLPRLARPTWWAVLTLVGGILLLVVPQLVGDPVGPGLKLLAIVGIVGGFAALVWRMRDSRDQHDDDSDDGAVV